MSINMKRKGSYQAFETTKHHKILVLDNKDYFAWVDTSQGHLLVESDSDHKKEKDLNNGEYVLFSAENDSRFQDNVDHLELQEDGKYHSFILPNGLPDPNDKQKKLVDTDEYLPKEKIESLS